MESREFLYDEAQHAAAQELHGLLESYKIPGAMRYGYNLLNIIGGKGRNYLENSSFLTQVMQLYRHLSLVKEQDAELAKLRGVCERLLCWHSCRMSSMPTLHELRVLADNLRKYLPDTELYPHYSMLCEIKDNYDLYCRREWLMPALKDVYYSVYDIFRTRLEQAEWEEGVL